MCGKHRSFDSCGKSTFDWKKNCNSLKLYIVVIEYSFAEPKNGFRCQMIFASNFRCQLLSKMFTASVKSSLQATGLKDCMPLYEERFIFNNTHHPEAIWKFLLSVKNNSDESLQLRFGEHLNLNNFCRFLFIATSFAGDNWEKTLLCACRENVYTWYFVGILFICKRAAKSILMKVLALRLKRKRNKQADSPRPILKKKKIVQVKR